jgi:hypothetical protein
MDPERKATSPSVPSSVSVPPLPVAYAAPHVANAPFPQTTVPPEWTHVEIFPLDPARLRRFLTIVVVIRLGIWVVMGGIVIGMMAIFSRERSWSELLGMSICYVTVFGILAVVDMLREVFRTRRSWKVCELILADEGLLLTQAKGPAKRVNRADVTRIVETFDSFRVHLPRTYSIVSKRYQSPEHIRERLASWQAIEQGKGSVGLTATLLAGLGISVGILVLFLAGLELDDKLQIAGCAAGCLALCIVQIIRTMRNRSLRSSTRVISLVNVIFPIILALRWLFHG